MDLGSECSALESVEDNELTTLPEYSVSNFDGDDNDGDGEEDSSNGDKANNGPCSIKIHGAGNACSNASKQVIHFKEGEEGEESEHVGNSGNLSPLTAKSPVAGSPPATKGYGLKKWKRIKRGVAKDVPVSVDNYKNLKRPSSANPVKPTDLTSFEIKQNSEGSVGSVNAIKNVPFSDGFVNFGSSFDSRFAVGPAFMAGTDSDNSEDRCSKSSTATSAPRGRYELPAFVRDKPRVKSLAGKGTASSSQRVQQAKGQIEGSKKLRGERVKIEKENSHSSLESDSRNSNSVLMPGASSVPSHGKQVGMPTAFDGENSDEAHADDQQFSEEVQADFQQENAGEIEDLLRDGLAGGLNWGAKEDKENMTSNRPSTDEGPLIESILALQSVQEALESEIQKLADIGTIDGVSVDFISACSGIQESGSSDQLESQSTRKLTSLESEMCPRQSVMHLESRLEEARTILKLQACRVGVEATLNQGVLPNVELGNTVQQEKMNCKEVEMEIEDLFMQKIQSEVEYLALACALEKLRIDASNHIRLQREQQQMVESEQAKSENLVEGEESKENVLKKQAEELEKYKGDFLGTDGVLKMQRRVCKVTSYFFIQLILVILMFQLLGLQLSTPSNVVVPT